MSEENVQAVRAGISAFNRGDADAMIEFADPGIEYQAYLAALFGGENVYNGHDGSRRFVRDLQDAWESFEAEIDEYHAVGRKVVAVGKLRARGRASGLEVTQDLAWVATIRERIRRLQQRPPEHHKGE